MAYKAIFLDRDNTLIEDPGYINDPSQVQLLPGTTSALADMRNMGYKLIIVTNQSGVARGIVTEEKLAEIHQRLLELLRNEGVTIDRIYYCPYHPEGVIEKYRKQSSLRKPSPGMLLLASEEMDIDLKYSWMIGDSYRDIEAGRLAGCRTILINSPAKPTEKEYSDPEPDGNAVNIKEAANIIKMAVRDGKLPFKVAEKRKVPNIPKPTPKPDDQDDTQLQTQEQPESEMHNIQRQRTDNEEYEEEYHDVDSQYEENDSYDEHHYDYEDEYYEEDPLEDMTHDEKTIYLLKQITERLGKHKHSDLYEDFSMLKMFAGIIQILVFFCLIISVWFLLDQTREMATVHTMIGYAVVFQLMAIAFYIMNWRK